MDTVVEKWHISKPRGARWRLALAARLLLLLYVIAATRVPLGDRVAQFQDVRPDGTNSLSDGAHTDSPQRAVGAAARPGAPPRIFLAAHARRHVARARGRVRHVPHMYVHTAHSEKTLARLRKEPARSTEKS